MIPYVFQMKNLSIFLLYDKDLAVWEVTTFSSSIKACISFPEINDKNNKIDAYSKELREYRNSKKERSFFSPWKNPPPPQEPEGMDTVEWLAWSYSNNRWSRIHNMKTIKTYIEFGKMVNARMEELNEASVGQELETLGFQKIVSAEAFFEVIGYSLLPDPLKVDSRNFIGK